MLSCPRKLSFYRTRTTKLHYNLDAYMHLMPHPGPQHKQGLHISHDFFILTFLFCLGRHIKDRQMHDAFSVMSRMSHCISRHRLGSEASYRLFGPIFLEIDLSTISKLPIVLISSDSRGWYIKSDVVMFNPPKPLINDQFIIPPF